MKHDSDILKRIKNYFMRRKSAREAYDFEREMERDPFLYEAMEGLEEMLTSDIQQSLDELDDQLDEKSKNKFAFAWWQVAMIGAFVAIGSSLFVVLRHDSDSSEIQEVVNEPTNEQQYSPRNMLPVFDWEDSTEIVAFSDSSSSEKNQFTPQPEKELMSKEAVFKSESKEEKTKAVPAESLKELEIPKQKGETTSDVAATDDDRAESLFSSDLLQTSESTSSDNAVRQSSTEPAAAQGINAKEESSKDRLKKSAQPVKGMAAYQTYLKKNLKTSEGMPKGSVTVTFELDRSGKPRKLEIAKSLCTACDAEAMRLIENGPEWEAEDRKERVSVTVEFP